MTLLSNQAFDILRQIPLYVPGKPIQEVQRELGLASIVKLASNENPWGPTEAVKARLRKAVEGSSDEGLGLYPVSDGYYLRTAIARRRGLNVDQLILGNGSSEIIEMAAKAALVGGGSAVAPKHAFAIYGIATQTAGGRFIECPCSPTELDVDAILAAVQADTRVVFLGNPNNPTGVMLGREGLERLVRDLRDDILLVVDQAYAEYEDPETYPDAKAYLEERSNLLVLHTFSKIHALAALRIGYGIGHHKLLALLERVRSPFNTNMLAQAAAEVAIEDYAFEAMSRARNHEARQAFLKEAQEHRCQVTGMAGNFMLLESMLPAAELFKDLLRAGVIVRPMQGYGLPNHVRVTMGKPEEMDAFWAAITPILDNAGCGCR
ncbi:histidinol-phosphate transaminase [Mesoterricola sediminis]|uniref:Histidinol-phosphate aminotransferase n=1 Tax=Mesoterricola sediminis TaxID=2927980 RepID=A0AA48GY39_9BACT|nr:histidinol-phosphate transaminase [Mesoterricola sediminis]BDU76157.1 histidinol-phosphate aminotransferase 2 [Mesoterricola sediminis]